MKYNKYKSKKIQMQCEKFLIKVQKDEENKTKH